MDTFSVSYVLLCFYFIHAFEGLHVKSSPSEATVAYRNEYIRIYHRIPPMTYPNNKRWYMSMK